MEECFYKVAAKENGFFLTSLTEQQACCTGFSHFWEDNRPEVLNKRREMKMFELPPSS